MRHPERRARQLIFARVGGEEARGEGKRVQAEGGEAKAAISNQ
jgi:hypothetical protein